VMGVTVLAAAGLGATFVLGGRGTP
jgi:hypothetical protein